MESELLYIADKSLFDEAEVELVTLYRYLGLRHRSMNPLMDEHYSINFKLKNLLDRAICESASGFFEIAYDSEYSASCEEIEGYEVVEEFEVVEN